MGSGNGSPRRSKGRNRSKGPKGQRSQGPKGPKVEDRRGDPMTRLVRWVVAVGVLCGSPSVLAAQGGDTEAVKALELKRFDAMQQNDFSALEGLLADDMIYTHSSGQADTKAQFLEALRTGKSRYVKIAPTDTNVNDLRRYGRHPRPRTVHGRESGRQERIHPQLSRRVGEARRQMADGRLAVGQGSAANAVRSDERRRTKYERRAEHPMGCQPLSVFRVVARGGR